MSRSSRLFAARGVPSAFILFWLVQLSSAQSATQSPTAVPAPEQSHVRRFATPERALQYSLEDLNARIAKTPADAQAWTERGVLRVRTGQTTEGTTDLRHAVELDPKSADAEANLGYAYLAAGDVASGRQALTEALKLNPEHAGANFYLGRTLMESGDLAKSLPMLEKAAAHDPENIEMQFELFSAYRRSGDRVKSALQLRILRMVLPPEHPSLDYAEGLLQADLGNVSGAISRFQLALKRQPDMPRARQDLAMALVQTAQWEEAAKVIGPMAQSEPRSFLAAYLHALALINLGNQQDGMSELQRALKIQPENPDALALQGMVLFSKADFAGAQQVLSRATTLQPSNFDAQFYLGRTKLALDDAAGASESFARALKLNHSPDVLFLLATALEIHGETASALNQYREMVGTFPADPRGYLGLGALLQKQGKLEEAQPMLERANQLDAKNYEASLTLGKLLVKRDHVDEGARYLKQATDISPEKAEAHYQLALALNRLNRKSEADAEFATVNKLNSGYRAAEEATPKQ